MAYWYWKGFTRNKTQLSHIRTDTCKIFLCNFNGKFNVPLSMLSSIDKISWILCSQQLKQTQKQNQWHLRSSEWIHFRFDWKINRNIKKNRNIIVSVPCFTRKKDLRINLSLRDKWQVIILIKDGRRPKFFYMNISNLLDLCILVFCSMD